MQGIVVVEAIKSIIFFNDLFFIKVEGKRVHSKIPVKEMRNLAPNFDAVVQIHQCDLETRGH